MNRGRIQILFFGFFLFSFLSAQIIQTCRLDEVLWETSDPGVLIVCNMNKLCNPENKLFDKLCESSLLWYLSEMGPARILFFMPEGGKTEAPSLNIGAYIDMMLPGCWCKDICYGFDAVRTFIDDLDLSGFSFEVNKFSIEKIVYIFSDPSDECYYQKLCKLFFDKKLAEDNSYYKSKIPIVGIQYDPLAVVGTAEIKICDSIEQVLLHAGQSDQKPLYLFDIDGMLIDVEVYAYEGRYPLVHAVRLCQDEITRDVVRGVQEAGCKAMGLTGRPCGQGEQVHQKLCSFGINFEDSSLLSVNEYLYIDQAKRNCYLEHYKGMLFIGVDDNDPVFDLLKGPQLMRLFNTKLCDNLPEYVVYIDDMLDYVLSVAEVLNSLEIPGTCYLYTGSHLRKLNEAKQY